MAAIPQPSGGSLDIKVPAPAGIHPAILLHVLDEFGVERTKYQSTEKEKIDVTRFVFGLLHAGHLFLTATYEMRISGASGSGLVKFLTAWMSKPPVAGWDYCELIRHLGQITVEQKQSKTTGAVYSVVTNISPLHPQLANLVPPFEAFGPLLKSALSEGAPSASPVAPVASPAPGGYAGAPGAVQGAPVAHGGHPSGAPYAPAPGAPAPGFPPGGGSVPSGEYAPQAAPVPQPDSAPMTTYPSDGPGGGYPF